MPRNTEGEFELVLGNKQLLSMFFLVVVLFAVFFSLGYMVGKSVSPSPTQAAQPPVTTVPAPAVEAPPPRPGKPAAEDAAQAPAAVTETQPAQSEPPPKKPAAQPAAAPPPAAVAAEIHLQLAALRVQQDAQNLAESVRKKGYSVVVDTSGADGLHRVLVGPFADDKTAQHTRAQLEKDGYKSILKRP